MDGIEFLDAFAPEIREMAEDHIRKIALAAIGEEGMRRVSIAVEGTTLDDMELHISGPEDLKEKLLKAFFPDNE